MSHMCHITYMNEWCFTYKRDMFHVWIKHVSQALRIWRIMSHTKWVTSYVWMIHFTHEWVMPHINQSSHACVMSHLSCEWVIPYIRMSHVPHINKPCLAYDALCYPHKWVTSAVCHTYAYVCPNTASTSRHHLRGFHIHLCIYVYIYHITICMNIMYMHVYVYMYICIYTYIYI